PVNFPVSREFGVETSSQLTASSATQSGLCRPRQVCTSSGANREAPFASPDTTLSLPAVGVPCAPARFGLSRQDFLPALPQRHHSRCDLDPSAPGPKGDGLKKQIEAGQYPGIVKTTLDGVDQRDYLEGKSQKSARDTFFYYSGKEPSAVRYKNWK